MQAWGAEQLILALFKARVPKALRWKSKSMGNKDYCNVLNLYRTRFRLKRVFRLKKVLISSWVRACASVSFFIPKMAREPKMK